MILIVEWPMDKLTDTAKNVDISKGKMLAISNQLPGTIHSYVNVTWPPVAQPAKYWFQFFYLFYQANFCFI